jgi:5-formyltetrahydrofolate cyclo-ligase
MKRPEMDDAAEQALRGRAKQELRKRMAGVRRVMPLEACAARSAALCARLCELREFERASTVIGYVATRKEADPASALSAAHAAGKRVGLVRVEEDGRLWLHRYAPGDALVDNSYGIAEPDARAPRIEEAEVSLIIVPALVVDSSGYRVGYGKGYYDRLLPRLERAFSVVIAYDFQLLAEAPHTHGDVAVDCVVTDKQTLHVRDGATSPTV